MRLAAVRRGSVLAAVAALSLTLSACNGDESDAHASGGSGSGAGSGNHAGAKPSGSAAAALPSPTKGGTEDGSSGSGSGVGDGEKGVGTPVSDCGTADLGLRLVVSGEHATSKTAHKTAQLFMTNRSSRTCLISGFPTVSLADQAGRRDPITAKPLDGEPGAAFPLHPGKAAVSELRYNDVNWEGSPSGRYTCGMEANTVTVAVGEGAGATVAAEGPQGGRATVNACDDLVEVEDIHEYGA